MKTESQIRAHLLEKAASDEAFRARLVADPRKTVADEFAVSVPDHVDLQVHEETATSFHLVLPSTGERLNPSEMQAVSGGSNTWGEGGPW